MPHAPALELIQSQLARTRKIWRASEVLSRGFLWFIGLLVTVLTLCALDNLLRLPSELRMGLSLALLAGGLASLAGWVLRPLLWHINDQAAAVYLERKLGERENLLINAIQLSQKAAGSDVYNNGFSMGMIAHVAERAAKRAAEMSLKALWNKRRLKKLGMATGVVFSLILLYAALLPAYAHNAFLRFASPLAGIPPISRTHIFVAPAGTIEVFAGDKLTVRGLAAAERGEILPEAALLARVDGANLRVPMPRAPALYPDLLKEASASAWLPTGKNANAEGGNAQAFVYEFPSIDKSFSFHLACGDGESAPCNVVVRERPGVKEINLAIMPPAYTGLATTHDSSPSGLIEALAASQVTFTIKPTLPLKAGRLNVPGRAVPLTQHAGEWEAIFELEREGPYTLSLTSLDGTEAERALEGQLAIKPDALPSAAFENQSLNVAAVPGSTVPLAVRAQDDFGLKSLTLIIETGLAGEENNDSPRNPKQLKAWSYAIPGPKGINELYPLTLNPAVYPAGNTYAVYAEVTDHCPTGKRLYRSAPLVIRVLTPEQMELGASSPFASIFNQIQELINLETKARGKTITVKEFLTEVLEKKLLGKRLGSIRDEQVQIGKNAEKLLADIRGSHDEKIKTGASKMSTELDGVIKGPMAQAIFMLKDPFTIEKPKPEAAQLLQKVETVQTEIINRLTALLGAVTALDKDKKLAQADLKDDQDGQRLRDKLEEAHEKIKDFVEKQKKIIKSTEELEQKKPDDMTDEEKKALGEMAKEEKDWAKYFREQATDLSKLPNQDFSNSKLAEELNAVFQEIQKAADALNAKHNEVAVKAEEGGLELAKKIETNLEKWLPTAPDTTKWSMEEPKGEFDVPLADLPKELEDIIGALIDKEEDMTDDVQDTSSSWMDSADKGAGWDVGDGNISNMSAKGITGNQLPNKQEVGGRSGEGRNGKSSGQFVSDTAEGKGGPQTPTRATQDPYEQGQVKDTSKEAQGGSTGGGKESGVAAAGLRGTPPQQTLQKMERLRGAEAQIRQQAEKVSTQLHAYHLPSSDCDEAVRRMKQIEDKLQTGRGFDLRQAHTGVIDSLKEAQKIVGFQGDINRERSRDLPKHVRNRIISGMHTPAAPGYQDLMEAYYKALVEPEKE